MLMWYVLGGAAIIACYVFVWAMCCVSGRADDDAGYPRG